MQKRKSQCQNRIKLNGHGELINDVSGAVAAFPAGVLLLWGSVCLRQRELLLIWAYHMHVLNMAVAGGSELGLFVCYVLLWGITVTCKCNQIRDDREL